MGCVSPILNSQGENLDRDLSGNLDGTDLLEVRDHPGLPPGCSLEWQQDGKGIIKIAKELRIGIGTVKRIVDTLPVASYTTSEI